MFLPGEPPRTLLLDGAAFAQPEKSLPRDRQRVSSRCRRERGAQMGLR